MNKIHRLVWSCVRNAWVVAHECAKAAGKAATTTSTACAARWGMIAVLESICLVQAAPPVAATLPSGGQIVSGSGNISQSGNAMTVNQATDKLITNWQSFDIGNQASVSFNQPGADSIALNRITGQSPTQIFGQLNANGQVILMNPAGVVFGQGSQVNVGGIVASTLSLTDTDFLGGRLRFVGTSGEIVNQGTLSAQGGVVALVAPVVRNEGTITTPNGTAVLAAAQDVSLDFTGTGLLTVTVAKSKLDALAQNHGLIQANGGRVILTAGAARDVLAGAVGNSGVIEANALTQQNGRILLEGNWISQEGRLTASGGQVNLQASQGIYLDGEVDVSSMQGQGGHIGIKTGKLEGMAESSLKANGTDGGSVKIEGTGMVGFSSAVSATGVRNGGVIEATGANLALLNAKVDASGGVQGGTVHLGGGWQGTTSLPQAQETFIGVGTEVRANGGGLGQGGEVVVWSTQASQNNGRLQAKDGGRIELSSKGKVQLNGGLDAGFGGNVLLDPKNLIITATPPNNLTMVRRLASGSMAGGPALANNDWFGNGLALDGDRLAVGAILDDTGGTNRGAVYLFTGVGTDYSALTWQKKIANAQGAVGMPVLTDDAKFGASISLKGNLLAIGSTGDGTSGGICVTNCGAVHLFNGAGGDFSGLTWQKKLADTTGATGMPTFPNDIMFFGISVALDGDRLVVGTPYEEVTGVTRGAVYAFTGVGSDFSGLTYRNKVTTSQGAIGMPALGTNDSFGNAVSLNGDRLAIGTNLDDTGGTNWGAVHLFTGVGSDFSGLQWVKKLASGTGAVNQPTRTNGAVTYQFGYSVALDADRLAVGMVGDDIMAASAGSALLYTGVGNDYSGLTFQKYVHSGTVGTMPALAANSFFGTSIALDGDRMAVGAPLEDAGGVVRGAMYLFNGVLTFPSGADSAVFSQTPDATTYMTPATIESILNTGSAVTLQANNDITVSSAIAANNPGGNGGNLTFQAGRNINFNANVGTDNGNLTAVAGDSGAISAYTDAGTPTMTIANGVSLNAGTGNIVLASRGGNFVNNSGSGALAGGAWQVWSSDPASDTRGGLVYDYKQYNATYGSTAVLGTGRGFLYSLAPVITPSLIGAVSKVYDGNTATSLTAANYTSSGAIDGDIVTLNDPAAGNYDTKNVGTGKNVTATGIAIASATNGSATVYGYQLSSTTANGNIGTITPKALTLNGLTPNNKIYDGSTLATIGSYGSLVGLVTGDAVNLNSANATANYADKNVGIGKTVTVANLGLAGLDASNYSFVSTQTGTSDLTPKALTLSGLTPNNKIYDGSTNATIGSYGNLVGVVTGENVTLDSNSATANYADKNVGIGKTVTVANLGLAGLDISNYSFITTQTATADLTPKSLSLTGLTINNKPFDGNTTASVGTFGSLTGVLAGETVVLSSGGSNANFVDGFPGQSKPVNVLGLGLQGSDAGNYAIGTQVSTADITSNTKQYIPELESPVLNPDPINPVKGVLDLNGRPIVDDQIPILLNVDLKADLTGVGQLNPVAVNNRHNTIAVAIGAGNPKGVSQTSLGDTVIPVFDQPDGGRISPVAQYKVTEQGGELRATAFGQSSALPTLERMRQEPVVVPIELPDKSQSQLLINITNNGVLLVRAAERIKHVYGERHIMLLGLMAARQRLGVALSDIKAVLIQAVR
ncbi:YDG domain-containing protein [Chitinimonas sp. BJB300]|uniref:YDG domain-containing protein n=1 Tax=Chitinimonas sp. BJB300 TaxID=1559339 RepID=UPI0013042CB2|nr:YDG domain-containing protein [Chitinimonas sp. BJB300]